MTIMWVVQKMRELTEQEEEEAKKRGCDSDQCGIDTLTACANRMVDLGDTQVTSRKISKKRALVDTSRKRAPTATGDNHKWFISGHVMATLRMQVTVKSERLNQLRAEALHHVQELRQT